MQIKEIELLTKYPDEQKEFYKNVLDLQIGQDNGNEFTVIAGSSRLKFVNTSAEVNPFYHFAFNIPSNQFTEGKKWALERVKLIKSKDEDEFNFNAWNAKAIYFYDPAGNILELISRNNLNNLVNENFSGKSLLCISEIGLPVHDVNQSFEMLKKNFNIKLYSGDLKTFAAAGDENGLFILVNKGRKWFPDCAEARIFLTKIELNLSENKEIVLENLNYKIISIKDS